MNEKPNPLATVAITGAASGIGRAFAREAASDGYALALLDLDSEGLDDLATELRSQTDRVVTTHVMDVSDRNGWAVVAEQIREAHHAISIIVNNAGISLSPQTFEATDVELFDRVLAVNLHGALYAIRYLLPMLRRERGCGIINISSLAGRAGLYGYSSYSMSKMALRGLGESLQMEFAGTGLHCLNVFPGGAKTAIMKNAPDMDKETARIVDSGFQKMASLSPERIARKSIRAFRRRRRGLILGIDAKLILVLRWILGPLANRVLKAFFSMQMEMSIRMGNRDR